MVTRYAGPTSSLTPLQPAPVIDVDHQVAALPLDLYALARWIAYAATLVTIGGGVCAWLLGRIPEPEWQD